MEFGNGGRIVSLWSADPSLPEEGEDFQFVLPPLPYGEENAEDLYPGTILIGARTGPNDPWIFSRNAGSTQLPLFDLDDDEEPSPFNFDAQEQKFEYEFSLLPEIEATGRFYEVVQPFPQIIWEVEIKNRGRVSIEIGELGFPLAFNTFYDGFGWSDEQLKKLWNSRLYVHKFIGGAASWVHAQRMTSEPPGLLVFPGDPYGWEFFASVSGSIRTAHQWEGIPVVYAYSRATVEREGWRPWMNEHSSFILEPGDQRTFQVRFIPTDRDREDGVNQSLAACGRPAIRVMPGCVVPLGVPIEIDVQGVQTGRFYLSRDAHIDVQRLEDRTLCRVSTAETGPLRVTFDDQHGRVSHVHLMIIEPIDRLISKRAEYITQHQVVNDESSPLHHAIVLADTLTNEPVTDPDEFAGASGIECSLADALFLAEKNAHYPERDQIQLLDQYIQDFLQDNIQNPADFSVGSVLSDGGGLGSYVGRPATYPPAFGLYHAMYCIARTYGETRQRPEDYLRAAARTAQAMFQFGWRHYVRTVGLAGYSRIYDIIADLKQEGILEEFSDLCAQVDRKAHELVKMQYPYAGESALDTSGFEEVVRAALYCEDDEHLERTLRCAFAARSNAPSWWWYGSDKRSWDGADSAPMKALSDRGEACLAHTTIPNALTFFATLDRDYPALPDVYMRLAFGGMVAPWALVRKDGAASMCCCPDFSSKHAWYNRYSGASGLGYAHYLHGVGAYVLPNGPASTFAFGCHFQAEGGAYIVRPWDGVGRRITLRQIGATFNLSFGVIKELRLDARKRWFELQIHNPSDKDITCELRVIGMWGTSFQVVGRVLDSHNGVLVATLSLPAGQSMFVTGKVIS